MTTPASAGTDERRGPSRRELVAALAIYALATLALSYPLSTSPRSLSRLDNGDARLNAWAISWVAHQLPREPLELFEANTFHPLEKSLAFSEHLTLLGVLAIPLLAATDDLVLTVNAITLFAMLASALSMYLLAYRLSASHGAALAAGLFFSFAPFRFNRLPHIQMQLYAFVPLVLLGAHGFLQERRARFVLLAFGALVLQALAGTYLGAIASIALALALVTLVPGSGLRGRDHLALLLGAGGAAAALLPFTLPYLWVNRELGVEWDLGGLHALSATPSAYLASSTHLYRGLTEALTDPSSRTDYLFPGLTLTLLGTLGFIYALRERPLRRFAVCYGVILCAGVVLSLGPRTPVYPFLYEHVVFFRGLRALTRFALLPLLSLSLLSALALKALLSRAPSATARRLLLIVTLGFFSLESTAIPYGLAPHRDEPPEVYRWLRGQDPGPFVELPYKVVDTRYMFWARHHAFRPTLNGDSGFIPMSHQWMKVALARFPSPDAIALLRRQGVRYVVLHLGAFRPRALSRLLTGLEARSDALLPLRDFGGQLVYEVSSGRPEPAAPPSLALEASGSEPALFDGDSTTRPPGDDPVLRVGIDVPPGRTAAGVVLHYGPAPASPAVSIELVPEGSEAPRWTTSEDWPAVASLVDGLVATPLDGTQRISFPPVTGRFELRLRGIDGRRPDITELRVVGDAPSPD